MRGSGFSMTTMGEVLPRHENHVRIDTNLRDEWGIPALHIHQRYSENEHAMARDAMEAAAEMCHGAGFQLLAKHSTMVLPAKAFTSGYLPHGRGQKNQRPEFFQPKPRLPQPLRGGRQFLCLGRRAESNPHHSCARPARFRIPGRAEEERRIIGRKRVRIVILSLCAFFSLSTANTNRAAAAVQPQKHSQLGLTCKTCHKNADPGESTGIAPVSSCMGCHKTAAAESPAIKRLRKIRRAEVRSCLGLACTSSPATSFQSSPPPGSRHNLSNLSRPRRHQDQLRRETDISMGGCMDCHIKNRARNDCNYCHEPR